MKHTNEHPLIAMDKKVLTEREYWEHLAKGVFQYLESKKTFESYQDSYLLIGNPYVKYFLNQLIIKKYGIEKLTELKKAKEIKECTIYDCMWNEKGICYYKESKCYEFNKGSKGIAFKKSWGFKKIK